MRSSKQGRPTYYKYYYQSGGKTGHSYTASSWVQLSAVINNYYHINNGSMNRSTTAPKPKPISNFPFAWKSFSEQTLEDFEQPRVSLKR